MAVLVRSADSADVVDLARIMAVASQAAYVGLLPASVLERESEVHWRRCWPDLLADPGHWALVAVRGERTQGLSLSYGDDEAACATLGLLYLDPAAWGTGTGEVLLDATLAALRARGFERCSLWVLECNRRARSFYEKHGWLADGERRSFAAGLTSLRYQHELG